MRVCARACVCAKALVSVAHKLRGRRLRTQGMQSKVWLQMWKCAPEAEALKDLESVLVMLRTLMQCVRR